MKFILTLFFSYCIYVAYGQPSQISIARVEQMPNDPSPYVMRDWKSVAAQYDQLIFNTSWSGTHLPVLTLKPIGRNYPALQPIQLDSYVGTNSSSQAEAINIIPALVSASLVGIDKSNQQGVNWVEKIKDFYNSVNNQNVYLNGSNSVSGNDWWYDVMPNIFFYQLYDMYRETPDFNYQFKSVADQWLKAVYAMGGSATPWKVPSMNYRGWYLSSMTGNSNGVKEPEAAGGIGWLLYQAYQETGDRRYLDGAQMSLEFLTGLTTNPSYELQLPYGTLTAAKLNAQHEASHDILKLLNWSFDRGQLRGWGTIVGEWNGHDVSGLIGEANDQGNDYAFLMNGFQQAGALVPVAKYDKRFSRAIAKWVLNLANASRLFYPKFLDNGKQDDFAWSSEYDPESVIGYEALKEQWDGKALYGTGDAKRNNWAATNLALYGSSHSGYLGAIIKTTDVDRILQIDANRTDFFADHLLPTYLFFNPYPTEKIVTLDLGATPVDIYDAISETWIAQNVSGNHSVNIKGDEVILLTYVPSGTTIKVIGNKLYAGDHIVDYHVGYDFAPDFRMKSFAASEEIASYGQEVKFFSTIENPPAAVVYKWFVNDNEYSQTSSGEISWLAPSASGQYEIKVEAYSGELVIRDSLIVNVLAVIPTTPAIQSIVADKEFYIAGETAKIIVNVQDAEIKDYQYTWTVSGGAFQQQDSLINWTPESEGLYQISVKVQNEFELTSTASINVLVKVESTQSTSPLAYYPLNTDANDHSGNDHHAVRIGTQQVDDAAGRKNFAAKFSSADDIIYVQNSSALNFTEAITLSAWISPQRTGRESFVLSHGSWEERWKLSLTPDNKLRWTVKTDEGTRDLDSFQPVIENKFVHVAVVYSGYSLEMYLDGALENFTNHGGAMLTTDKAITFGQKSSSETQYFYQGVLDEVRIYDRALQPNEILTLKDVWADEVTSLVKEYHDQMSVFPNPVSNGEFWISHGVQSLVTFELIGIDGKSYRLDTELVSGKTKVTVGAQRHGLYILKVGSSDKIYFIKIWLK